MALLDYSSFLHEPLPATAILEPLALPLRQRYRPHLHRSFVLHVEDNYERQQATRRAAVVVMGLA